MIACYTDRLSAFPGETITLFASSAKAPCRLEVARIGMDRRPVLTKNDVTVGAHPTPPQADRDGCGWPQAAGFQIGEDWASGYYDIALTDPDGETGHHFLCVKAAKAAQSKAVLVLATNTLHAYNSWGGASAYCDVEALMSGRAKLAEAMAGAIGVLSTERPFSPLLVAPPADMPRLVNLRPRGFEERPWAGADTTWSKANRQSPYDGSAGFLNKWEHLFVRWAEAAGIEFDYLTDYDLDADPEALAPYRTVLLVGHSEYWSGPERDQIEDFVDGGGKLGKRGAHPRLSQMEGRGGGGGIGQRRHPPLVTPDVRPAGGAGDRPQLCLWRLSSSGSLRCAGPRRLHRLSSRALGA
jgi:hypothetical protein